MCCTCQCVSYFSGPPGSSDSQATCPFHVNRLAEYAFHFCDNWCKAVLLGEDYEESCGWVDELENGSRWVIGQPMIVHQWSWKKVARIILKQEFIETLVEVFKSIA